MEPPVSVPSESATSSAATLAVEPPEEPPGTREVSQGLLGAGLNALDSLEEPNANSSRLVLPRIKAPASINFWTGVAV